VVEGRPSRISEAVAGLGRSLDLSEEVSVHAGAARLKIDEVFVAYRQALGDATVQDVDVARTVEQGRASIDQALRRLADARAAIRDFSAAVAPGLKLTQVDLERYSPDAEQILDTARVPRSIRALGDHGVRIGSEVKDLSDAGFKIAEGFKLEPVSPDLLRSGEQTAPHFHSPTPSPTASPAVHDVVATAIISGAALIKVTIYTAERLIRTTKKFVDRRRP
jgi:hypothetical protein